MGNRTSIVHRATLLTFIALSLVSLALFCKTAIAQTAAQTAPQPAAQPAAQTANKPAAATTGTAPADTAVKAKATTAAATSATAAKATAANIVKIGVSGPFTGGSAPMGLSMREGVRIAAEEINTYVGGVLGKKIVLVERDDEANPAKGTAIANELVAQEKVIATIGIVNTGVGLSSIDVYQNAKIPVIIAVSTGTALTKKYAPPAALENFIFRTAPRTDIETSFLIEHITGRAGIRNIAILADATAYGESGKVDLEKAMTAKGIKPVAIERFKVGDTDMSAQLLAAKAAGADAIILYGIGPELAAIVKSRDTLKWKVPTFAGWTASMQNFIQLSGKSGEGVMMPQTFISQSANVRHKSFIAAYTQRTGSNIIPSPMSAAQGYDALRLLYNAIQSTASIDGVRIKDSLERIRSVEGVISTHRAPFTPDDHDAISANMLVMGKIINGRADFAFSEDSAKSASIKRK